MATPIAPFIPPQQNHFSSSQHALLQANLPVSALLYRELNHGTDSMLIIAQTNMSVIKKVMADLKDLKSKDLLFGGKTEQCNIQLETIIISLRKFIIATNKVYQVSIQSINTLRSHYNELSQDGFHKNLIHDLYTLHSAMADYLYHLNYNLRVVASLDEFRSFDLKNTIPTGYFHRIIPSLRELEKLSKHLNNEMKHFQKRHKKEAKEIVNYVFKQDFHANPSKMTSSALVATSIAVVSWSAVFIIFGDDLAQTLSGDGDVAAMFGGLGKTALKSPVKAFGQFFFSSGTSVVLGALGKVNSFKKG